MEVEHGSVETNTGPNFDAFLQTGRTGRRNALPDILDDKVNVSTASLPCSFQKLTCSENATDDSSEASGSSVDSNDQPSTSSDGTTPKS